MSIKIASQKEIDLALSSAGYAAYSRELEPTAPKGTAIWSGHPGCCIDVYFHGQWTNVAGGTYYDANGDTSNQINGLNAYMVMLRIAYFHPASGKRRFRTGWFPYTNQIMRFGPYANWKVIIRARMNDLPGTFKDHRNDPAAPMHAHVYKRTF